MTEIQSWEKLGKSLTPTEDRQLREVLQVLRSPIDEHLLEGSNLVNEKFAEEFRCRILLQHGMQGSPLFQDTFDAAFLKALIAGGHLVSIPAGQTERFWDLKLGADHVSLKSSKAKDLKVNNLHISKLSEAAWIQDCRSAKARRDATFELFERYLRMVGRMFQLRYFPRKKLYELVEIPTDLLRPIFKAPIKAFAAEGSNVGIPVGASEFDLTVVLDRSDAKITIRNIRKDRCIVHGTWQLE